MFVIRWIKRLFGFGTGSSQTIVNEELQVGTGIKLMPTLLPTTRLAININLASTFINNVASNEFQYNEFMDFASSIVDFTHTPEDANLPIGVILRDVLRLIKTEPIYVDYYKTKAPWSKAVGYAGTAYTPYRIFFNTRKFLEVSDFVDFLIHEPTHLADDKDGDSTFYGHHGNSVDNETAPYIVGHLMKQFYQLKNNSNLISLAVNRGINYERSSGLFSEAERIV